MFDLGGPFAGYMIYAAVWVVGYFVWAYFYRRNRND